MTQHITDGLEEAKKSRRYKLLPEPKTAHKFGDDDVRVMWGEGDRITYWYKYYGSGATIDEAIDNAKSVFWQPLTYDEAILHVKQAYGKD